LEDFSEIHLRAFWNLKLKAKNFMSFHGNSRLFLKKKIIGSHTQICKEKACFNIRVG
jgi:hypothetical protein